MARLSGIRRGVSDRARVAAFYEWLFEVDATDIGGELGIACANGRLAITDEGADVSIEFADIASPSTGRDPDDVPLLISGDGGGNPSAPMVLDHLSLVCADLAATTAFYAQLGLECTWSARGEIEQHGRQAAPIDGADWLHLSGHDGYVALSQADWQDYGRHSSASGPPRFVHVGIAVPDLGAITRRLDGESVPYLQAASSEIGERVYLNDPDGDPGLGSNIELVQYAAGIERSGRLATIAA